VARAVGHGGGGGARGESVHAAAASARPTAVGKTVFDATTAVAVAAPPSRARTTPGW